MMNEDIKKTQLYYDGISKGYKELYHQEQIEKINLVKNYFSEVGWVLDLGSGDGVLNNFISREVNLVSLDLSYELLKLNLNKNKVQASATQIPFKDNSFDLVFAFTIIQDLPKEKIEEAILEVKRVLKMNGRFIISFLKLSGKISLISDLLKDNFNILDIIEEEKDFIYILKN